MGTKNKKPIIIDNLTAGDFPLAVRHIWSNTSGADKNMRLALTLTSIVCFSGLSPRLRVKYTFDFVADMILLNLICIGHSGAGKNLINWLVNLLMKAQIIRDQEERLKLREAKEQEDAEGGKKNKKKKKDVLVAIRFLQKFTLPVAVKYCDFMYRRYGDWMPFFLYGSEFGSFTENRRGSAEFQSVARSSFSATEWYSRDTLYQDGYNAMVNMNWCSVMCGQDQALDKYIDKNGVVEGDAGRQILVMLDDNIGEPSPTIRPLGEAQMRDINATIGMLMAETYTDDDQLMPTHLVDMHWLDKDVNRWCDQTREQILKTGSLAMNSYYVRASLSSFRICTTLYHLWGEETPTEAGVTVEEVQKRVRRCYYFFAQLILDNAMARWGKIYEANMPKGEEAVKKPTLYDQMPKRFTRDMLRDEIRKLELGTPARLFIFKWMKKKWIYEVEKDVYEKLYG